jgi:2-dehydro-3-deoxyphosphogalactonate aldolase
MVKAFGDRALIGAGTVLQLEQVDLLAEMGCTDGDAEYSTRAD